MLVVVREEAEFGGQFTAEGDVRNGRFGVEFDWSLPGQRQTLVVHFLGGFGAAPADSEVVAV